MISVVHAVAFDELITVVVARLGAGADHRENLTIRQTGRQIEQEMHAVRRPIDRLHDQIAIVRIRRVRCIRVEADDAGHRRQPIDINRALKIRKHRRPTVAARRRAALSKRPHCDVMSAFRKLRGIDRLGVRARTASDVGTAAPNVAWCASRREILEAVGDIPRCRVVDPRHSVNVQPIIDFDHRRVAVGMKVAHKLPRVIRILQAHRRRVQIHRERIGRHDIDTGQPRGAIGRLRRSCAGEHLRRSAVQDRHRALRPGHSINQVTVVLTVIARNAQVHLARAVHFDRIGNHAAGVDGWIRRIARQLDQNGPGLEIRLYAISRFNNRIIAAVQRYNRRFRTLIDVNV